MDVRPAERDDIDYLARVWYDGWQDAHTRILSAELARVRTLESFRSRLIEALPSVRVAGPLVTGTLEGDYVRLNLPPAVGIAIIDVELRVGPRER